VLEKFAPISMSSRQVAYQLVGLGAIENTETEKQRVGRIIVAMRRDGSIPYSRIVDRTRAKHQEPGWDGVEDILDSCALQYRQNMWADQRAIPMIACEKQALEGVFSEVCDEYGVSLWIIRGFNSESFDYEWSEEIKEITDTGKHVVIAYFGDWDPSGLCIEETSKRKLREFGANFTWWRAGLCGGDFLDFGLAPIPVKRTDTRAKAFLSKFGPDAPAAELDALPPDELQRRIKGYIERCITDQDLWKRTKRDEQVQREALQTVTENWNIALAAARGER
jgi:hypothetical protein